ncbi:hypothetical protein CS542_04240 [Pedobacter sp. IW39]|nr:hypothetical protein CS542_04240 [Pedobacter sp. IW39]
MHLENVEFESEGILIKTFIPTLLLQLKPKEEVSPAPSEKEAVVEKETEKVEEGIKGVKIVGKLILTI